MKNHGLRDQKSYPLTNTFNRGKNDFRRGRLDNPYALYTSDAREWQRGFDVAYFDNLKKIGE